MELRWGWGRLVPGRRRIIDLEVLDIRRAEDNVLVQVGIGRDLVVSPVLGGQSALRAPAADLLEGDGRLGWVDLREESLIADVGAGDERDEGADEVASTTACRCCSSSGSCGLAVLLESLPGRATQTGAYGRRLWRNHGSEREVTAKEEV